MINTKLSLKHKNPPIRYMGSKFKLLHEIENVVKKHCGSDNDLVIGDLFSGTSVVSRHFKKLGYTLIANDNLLFCSILAKASLLVNQEPKFTKLLNSFEIVNNDSHRFSPSSYDLVLNFLNNLSGKKGFIHREYSPSDFETKEFQRKYFTEYNAKKIDTIREKISEWKNSNFINKTEEALLISDLLRATNKIANIAGTYGYFLKEWDPRTQKNLTLQKSEIIASTKNHQVHQDNANELVKKIKCDILYLDPPYTWRHYGAYYHILETIAKWDNPIIKGLSGLRSWEDSKSRYCYRNDAANALKDLIENSNVNHILLSYSNDGLISHDQLQNILSSIGKLSIHETKYRRYKSNNGTKENIVTERIYHVKK